MIRVIGFFMIVGMVSVHAHSYSQNITVNITDGKLTDLFQEIQEQSDFVFFYSDRLVTNEKITIATEKENIQKLLSRILKQRNLSYSISGKQITINAAQDSPIQIRGRIYDTAEPPSPVAGVSILIKGTQQGIVSDQDGYFTINVPRGSVLVFSMIGFHSQEYAVTRELNNLAISMDSDVSTMDEVVIMGVGEQQRKHIASSIASLNVASNIVGKPITSLSQSLQGGITGVHVQQGSALPGGDAATIKIRGISTLGVSDPLVLVDGIPMDMNFIDPVTVESVTVLKDAAAAAIYGARAANGVIVVTTKRGVPGRVAVTYDGYHGIQSPGFLSKLVDAPTYMCMYNEAQVNTGNSRFYSDDEIEKTSSGTDPMRYPNTDWIDLMVNNAAPISSHSLSLSGGNSLARFAVTGNYFSQTGMTPVTSTQRFNIRANTTVSLSENFLVNLDVLAMKLDWERPNRIDGSGGNRLLEDLYRVPPTILPRYPDNGSGRAIYGRWVDIVNPLAYAEQGGSRRRENGHSSINIQPRWTVLPGFNLKGQFSFRLNSDVTRDRRETFNFFDFYSGNLVQTWGQQRGTSLSRTTYYYIGASADYTHRIGAHHFYGIGGYSQEQTNSGSWDVWSIISGYAKLNYSYDDRFLLEAVARIDGSSRFGPGNRHGFFPSFAAGWNLHNEAFLKDVTTLNNFKLRVSYGSLGNENIGLYRYQTLINNSTGVESTWGNPNIKWEKVNMLDIGFDIGLFEGNKIEITADYYDKQTHDIILNPQVSYVGGLGNVPVNAGQVRNRGVELSINYQEQINTNLNIAIRPGITYNKNTVVRLYGGSDAFSSVTSINREGYPINSIYGFKTSGLLQESHFDADGTPLIPIATNAQPGDIRYLDINNDGIIDNNDQMPIGNPVPLVNYFANLRVTYKNFDAEMLFAGSGRRDIVLSGMLSHPLDMSFDGGVPTQYYADNYWTEGRPDALFPRLSVAPAVNKLSSDFWIQNGAYLRVRYIQLGYNLNGTSLTKFGVRNLRVYLNAQNPITFTGAKLVDPESAGNQWTYGIMRMYTLGLNVQF